MITVFFFIIVFNSDIAGIPATDDCIENLWVQKDTLHPHFSWSLEELRNQFPELSFTNSSTGTQFLNLVESMLEMPQVYLLLVDKKHPLPRNFTPQRLELMQSKDNVFVNKEGMFLDAAAYNALKKIAAEATKYNIKIHVSSAYRSFDYQNILFRRYASNYGEEEALRFSARPGTSQHQLGTAVDFGSITNAFAKTTEGKWLAEHAGKFGWSLSYPKGGEKETSYQWESWHWRWIGVAAVHFQENFFNGSQQAMLEFWNRHQKILKENKSLYYSLIGLSEKH